MALRIHIHALLHHHENAFTVGLWPCRSRDADEPVRQLMTHANNGILSGVGVSANSPTVRTVPPALVPCCRADSERRIRLDLNS